MEEKDKILMCSPTTKEENPFEFLTQWEIVEDVGGLVG
jgi:hypothetical protein